MRDSRVVDKAELDRAHEACWAESRVPGMAAAIVLCNSLLEPTRRLFDAVSDGALGRRTPRPHEQRN